MKKFKHSIKKRKLFTFILITMVLLHFMSCANQPTEEDNDESKSVEVEIFKKALVTFSGELEGFQENKDGFIQLDKGRVILKKVEFPEYTKDAKLELELTLVSVGDEYDRSGSCFIIPSDSEISMLDIAKGEKAYPVEEGEIKDYKGIIPSEGYKPTVELLRFMTPFGVGHYNYIQKPSHVEKWADNVSWNADISQLSPLFKDGAYVGIWIDTWRNPGFNVDLKITVTKNKKDEVVPEKFVMPILNTTNYVGQKYPDVFSKTDISTSVDIPEGAKNIKLYYTTTGHGGYAGGDEFTKRENIIKLDGEDFYRFIPWIDSCKVFRHLNPSSAVFQNGVASSDLARSNWCPGSDVKPKVLDVNVKGKSHTFEFSIPEAQEMSENKNNFWLVSAYLTWEE